MTSLNNKKPSFRKTGTNYSNAELSRKAKAVAEKAVRQRDIKRKEKVASDKINSTWVGNKKTKKATVKSTKSSAQLKAIFAKKK